MEEYIKILFSPTYEVSNLGNVRNSVTGLQLKKCPDKDGYLLVGLKDEPFNKYKTYKVHQLVMMSFIGPCPEGYVVDHKDKVRSNNRLDNLSYIPKYDSDKQGTYIILSKDDVLEIRRLFSNGIKQNILADKFKVSRSNIGMIVTKQSWKHI